MGSAHDVAPKDIEMLHAADKVFAILDGFDPGTVFEVGYARALGKRVVAYAEACGDEALKMFVGSNCEVVSDFASAIVRIATK
jgi:nucleoside 2-deoxyribosyltransferase